MLLMWAIYGLTPSPKNAKFLSGLFCIKGWTLWESAKLVTPQCIYADKTMKPWNTYFRMLFSTSIWTYFNNGGLNVNLTNSLNELIQLFIHTPQMSTKAILLSNLIGAVFWWLWLERNERILQSVNRNTTKLKMIFYTFLPLGVPNLPFFVTTISQL